MSQLQVSTPNAQGGFPIHSDLSTFPGDLLSQRCTQDMDPFREARAQIQSEAIVWHPLTRVGCGLLARRTIGSHQVHGSGACPGPLCAITIGLKLASLSPGAADAARNGDPELR